MLHNIRKRNEGFTIIEVMIVLAIAGLIMLIVFLAVPALQRNAHNTSIKNDVSAVLAAVNEYENNNNGQPPTNVAISGGVVTVSGASGTQAATGKVGYLTAASWTTTAGTAVPSAPGTVVVVQGIKCNATNTGSDTSGGTSTRDYAALFALEGSGNAISQCQEA